MRPALSFADLSETQAENAAAQVYSVQNPGKGVLKTGKTYRKESWLKQVATHADPCSFRREQVLCVYGF